MLGVSNPRWRTFHKDLSFNYKHGMGRKHSKQGQGRPAGSGHTGKGNQRFNQSFRYSCPMHNLLPSILIHSFPKSHTQPRTSWTNINNWKCRNCSHCQFSGNSQKAPSGSVLAPGWTVKRSFSWLAGLSPASQAFAFSPSHLSIHICPGTCYRPGCRHPSCVRPLGLARPVTVS